MLNRKIVVLRGLPKSGKSLHAARLVDMYNFKRISKQDLRFMLDNGVDSKDNNKLINRLVELMVDAAIFKGYDVVVDDLNLRPEAIERYRKLATRNKASFEVITFEEDLDTLLKRDFESSSRVGRDKIISLYRRFTNEGKIL